MRAPRHALVLPAALAVFVTLAVSTLRQKSATYDEPIYVTAGYTHLAFRDFRVNPQTPPLAKVIAAAPLVALGADFRTEDVAWREGYQNKLARQFFYRWNDADRLLLLTRLPIVALSCALAAALYFWTRRHLGPWPAAAALVLAVLSPDVLAHGSLATTDVALALFVFLAVAAFERLMAHAITPLGVLALGAAVGAALATKVSAVALFPMLALLGLRDALGEPALRLRARGGERLLATRRARLAAVGLVLLASALLAWLALWAAHGFQAARSRDPLAPPYDWSILPSDGAGAGVVRVLRDARLLPEPYVYGLAFRVAANAPADEGVAQAFLLGRTSATGWWYYFPVTFALKTPVPLLILVAATLGLTVRRPSRLAAYVWVPVAVYVALMMSQRLNLGHRYILPIYPFLFVAAASVVAAAHGRWRWLAGALLAWYAAGTLVLHPHYLAYFNELAGGPRNGYRLLVDSSLDWGQDLKGLKAWLDRKGHPPLKLSYFGMADPEYYGIRAERLPGFPPPSEVAEVNPGDWVAVSATNLQSVRLDQGRRLMRRLRETQPVDHVGYSILIYRPQFRWSPEDER